MTWWDFSSHLLVRGLVWLLAFCLLTLLVVGILAGSYPAFYLSRLSPLHALRDTLNTGRNRFLVRRVLVSAQFTASIALIVITLVIHNQLDYLRSKHLGFDKEHIVVIHDWDRQLQLAYSRFKSELAAYPHILGVSAGHPPSRRGGYVLPLDSQDPQAVSYLRLVTGDFDYPETLGLSFVSGESFSKDRMTDSTTAFIANELAMRRLAARGTLRWRRFRSGQAGGQLSAWWRTSICAPCTIPWSPCLSNLILDTGRTILVQNRNQVGVHSALAAIDRTWHTSAPGKPLAYTFSGRRVRSQLSG